MEPFILCTFIVLFAIAIKKLNDMRIILILFAVIFAGVKYCIPYSDDIKTRENKIAGRKASATNDEEEVLPQTKNPRAPKTQDESKKPTKNETPKEKENSEITNSINVKEYDRRYQDEKINKILSERNNFIPRQSVKSREKFLDALYEELTLSSFKKDPALRKPGTDGCEPLRGHAATIQNKSLINDTT